MTAKVSYSSLLPASTAHGEIGSRAGHLWENLPTRPGQSTSWVSIPTLTGAEIYVDNLPFAIDGTESVPEGLKDVSVDADKFVFVYCSKTEAGN